MREIAPGGPATVGRGSADAVSDDLIDTFDRASRRALAELVRRHPERTLAELLALDEVGERIGQLKVGELLESPVASERPARADAPGSRAPARPRERPGARVSVKTNNAALQREHDERVLETLRDLGGKASVKDIRAALEFGTDYQLASALRRLRTKQAIYPVGPTTRPVYHLDPARRPADPTDE